MDGERLLLFIIISIIILHLYYNHMKWQKLGLFII